MNSSIANKKLLVLIVPFFIGCASVHNGNFAKDEKGEVSIQEGLSTSGIENTGYSSDHFLPLEFTIENTTNDWIIVDEVKMNFKNVPPEELFLPTGDDLASWSQASTQLACIRQKNSAIIAGSILMVAGAASQSGSSSAPDPGSLALLATGTGLTMAGLSQNGSRLDIPSRVPNSHILSGSFTVPPGLFTKKWVVF